ncbi:hypothetical protein KHS38_07140 [Mucilaginibacter sp. Bleaf8]|uniref:LiaI-LiaF-like domain-containing protein n=1 Tax=Mucilaginibacter sp. Bleaf8 TaxID=2834430 RepID=UPI001BD0E714|nr:DUF5668 domain-containing protein [Mucilaginibacter sp. Bleaf8]MBS7564176.1 hypothetical protein [Mucilaginibacter sp. Bleaf8]
MRNDRLYPGMILVLIGTLFLLNNFGLIHFHWANLIYLWPVFLVIAGVNLLLASRRTLWATIVRVLVIVGGFALILFSNVGNRHNNPLYNFHYNIDDDGDDDDGDNDDDTDSVTDAKLNTYQQAYMPEVKFARLNISGGATTYKLNDTTGALFKAEAREYSIPYTLTTEKEDSVTVLNFDMKSHGHGSNNFNWSNGHSNSADIRLNNMPVWDINMRGGAAELNFDLSRFKIRNLGLHGGAASYKVKLAANQPVTTVNVTAGVSEIEISIPKNAACDIVTASGLTSTDFEGFDKVDNKHYTTAGFASAPNKIYINFKGGVSEFNVTRY